MTKQDLHEMLAARRAADIAYAAMEKGPPRSVRLGSLTMTMVERSRWQGTDAFPSSQLWADEVEKILSFAAAQGQFEYSLGALTGRKKTRGIQHLLSCG